MADSKATLLPRFSRLGACIVFLLVLPLFWTARGQVEAQPPSVPQAFPDTPQQPLGRDGVIPTPTVIDPKTPVEKLLPVAPKNQAKPVLINDLKQVPEVAFEQAPARNPHPQKSMEQVRIMIAGINLVNKKKTDAYMTALLERRADLVGLPFVMGEACRQKKLQKEAFFSARTMVVQQMGQGVNVPITEAEQAPRLAAEQFWDNLFANERQQDRGIKSELKGELAQGRVAALMQVCGPMSEHLRLGLARYLAGVSNVDATKALARLAIFSEEENIRTTAVNALKIRRERDYTDILVQGLNYPLPAVNQRASDAIAKLQRTDLAPHLIALLDEADPRAPRTQKIDNRDVPVMRELVKINHHRNCLLCHAPGEGNMQQMNFRHIQVFQAAITPAREAAGEAEAQPVPPPTSQATPIESADVITVTGAVPIPGHPLPSLASGYQSDTPDIFVRVDVTYLRQDFSLMLPVADAHPWPQMQRFDFLVRQRRLSEPEAQEVRDALKQAGPSPYRQNALAALRELTGQDAEPTGAAWRRALKLSQ